MLHTARIRIGTDIASASPTTLILRKETKMIIVLGSAGKISDKSIT